MRRIAVWLVLSLCAVSAFAQSDLYFSEYIEGSSNNKALEIYNPTGAPVSLAGYRIEQYSNGSATVGLTITLSGTVAPGDVYVVAHSSSVAAILAQADLTTGAGLFNGDDALVLRRGTTVIDTIGQVGFRPVNEWGSGNASTADNTLRRRADAAPDVNAFDPFVPADQWDGFPTNTFDGLGSHAGGTPPPPVVTTAEIFEIQGSLPASPLAGQTVETLDNIVTAVGHQGFFIQTPDFRADASTATSNGIYVYTGGRPTVAVGDQVDVKGPVVEYFNMTEFSGELTINVDASNQPVPAHVAIAPGFSSFEQLEGMLVRVTNGSAADGTDSRGETMIVAAPVRPFRTPGLGGDDHPEIFEVDPTGLGGAAPAIIGGAAITLAEGPLAFEFGNYSIWATALEYTNPQFPRGVRPRAAGEFTVAAQNLFQLFNDVDDPGINERVVSSAAYAAKLSTISAYVRTVLDAPDVLAVSEVESLTTLSDLAAKINADGGLDYTAYLAEGNDIGGIDVGFLVRGTVEVESVVQLGADDVFNGDDLLNDRPPLLLRGTYTGNGAPFPIAVIAVHQRSLIDVESSARVRLKRQTQAEYLAAYINGLKAAEPNLRLVVTGDFNAFEFNDGYVDVMGIITSAAALTNQTLSVDPVDRYSYVENGVAQVLDHALTSQALDPWVRSAHFVHANADLESTSTASDHDGVIVYVMTDRDGDGIADDEDACAEGDIRATVVVDGCDSGVPNISFPGGCTLSDRIASMRTGAKNHGQFVSEAGKLLNDLMKDGLLTGAQKGAIESCVARSNKG